MKRILSLLLIVLLLLVSCENQGRVGKEMTPEYLKEVGLEGFPLPTKEYSVSEKDYSHKYPGSTKEEFDTFIGEALEYLDNLGYPLYYTDPERDEQRGPFPIFDKYLFTPKSSDDFYVNDIRLEIYYEFEGEIFLINCFYENETITAQIISTKEFQNIVYHISEG